MKSSSNAAVRGPESGAQRILSALHHGNSQKAGSASKTHPCWVLSHTVPGCVPAAMLRTLRARTLRGSIQPLATIGRRAASARRGFPIKQHASSMLYRSGPAQSGVVNVTAVVPGVAPPDLARPADRSRPSLAMAPTVHPSYRAVYVNADAASPEAFVVLAMLPSSPGLSRGRGTGSNANKGARVTSCVCCVFEASGLRTSQTRRQFSLPLKVRSCVEIAVYPMAADQYARPGRRGRDPLERSGPSLVGEQSIPAAERDRPDHQRVSLTRSRRALLEPT